MPDPEVINAKPHIDLDIFQGADLDINFEWTSDDDTPILIDHIEAPVGDFLELDNYCDVTDNLAEVHVPGSVTATLDLTDIPVQWHLLVEDVDGNRELVCRGIAKVREA